jgi:hypothetical protein
MLPPLPDIDSLRPEPPRFEFTEPVVLPRCVPVVTFVRERSVAETPVVVRELTPVRLWTATPPVRWTLRLRTDTLEGSST